MKVLVINTGSSSLKYQLLNMENQSLMASGLIERIGEEKGTISHKKHQGDDVEKTNIDCEIVDHRKGMHLVIEMITGEDTGVIKEKNEIELIGHRVVQGGESSKGAKLINEDVKKAIEENNPLAPLHNPANLMGIEVAEELLPGTPNVAVFDTDFHSTMPPYAYIYPLPYEFYTDLKIRRYGFHGTSHKFVSRFVARKMGKNPEDINVITVHLGNGGSIAAVKNGECIDTSMGMTPLAGVMMGSRCGDIDPAIAGYIAERKGIRLREVDAILNKDSGLKGICGMNDMRDIHASIEKGDERAKLAIDMFAYRVKKYIGAYYAALGNVDVIVFTAGIGENDDVVRASVCSNLEGLGIELDLEKNEGRIQEPKKISKDESKVQLWVIPTNEELQIAKDAVDSIKNS
ncbi:MAG: acetate kinase [Desulfobacterales bacterium]|nr:acetate kinase [Desulfobacterales bacterium]